ncbi:MAG: hypothetical protein GYB65_00275 [Chloroflexi bacterium]|nr:hypothetical protein [Chloroflexota bacterium]
MLIEKSPVLIIKRQPASLHPLRQDQTPPPSDRYTRLYHPDDSLFNAVAAPRFWHPTFKLHQYLALVVVLGLIAALLAPLASVHAQDEPVLLVAWEDDEALTIWQTGDETPRQLASGQAYYVNISPDGVWIMSMREPGHPGLWITTADGTVDKHLFSMDQITDDEPRRVAQVAWAHDGRALYFNTLLGVDAGIRPADDLWRVAVPDGEPERLLADGEGGQIFPAPEGDLSALSAAGDYGLPGDPSVPGTIAFYDPARGTRTVALEFRAVATASSARWHARLDWLPDSSGVQTAIPPAELVYATEPAVTTLWLIPVIGTPRQTGTVEADFYHLPQFSNDGTLIAYLSWTSHSDLGLATTLLIANSDGTDPRVVREETYGLIAFDQWLPAGQRFLVLYGAPPALKLGQPGDDLEPFPGAAWLDDALWVDSTTYAALAPEYGQDGVYLGHTIGYGTLGGEWQPIVTLPVGPRFDAVRLD